MIRLYESKDYFFVKEIVEQELNYVMDQDDVFQKHFESIAFMPDYHLFVYELDGRAVALMGLVQIHSIVELGPVLMIQALATHRNYQNHGIGKKMLAYADEKGRENKCRKIMLVSHSRRTEAHAFYERNNFERNGYRFERYIK